MCILGISIITGIFNAIDFMIFCHHIATVIFYDFGERNAERVLVTADIG